MSQPHIRPCGTWPSPITAAHIASAVVGLSEIRLVGPDVWWLETRPTEGGRSVVVRRRPDGIAEDWLPKGFDARTRVHEYGGGSYVVADETLYFTNFADQRVYRRQSGEQPIPLTPPDKVRYADLVWDEHRQRILCVCEDHTTHGEAVAHLVALHADRGGPHQVVMTGRDFYAAPRLSSDGNWLAWIEWSHPDMPWDAASLYRAPVRDDGALGDPVHVAGGRGESAIQPLWSPDGTLYFVSDRTDWWNIYRLVGDQVEPVTELNAEFATPPWVFGMQHYAFASPARILCAFTRKGTWTLADLDTGTRQLGPLDLPFTDIASVQCDGQRVVFLGGSPVEPLSVAEVDLSTGRCDILRQSTSLDIPRRYFSIPQAIAFPTAGEDMAFGLFYPPQNPDFTAPADERPPLVVMIHGGPTSMTSTAFRLNIQYYTTRGIAVLDVNYRGSTGYGRAYRERLYREWGVADVDDCCAGAGFLATKGQVDAARLVIRGGSAGGYTTLACLAFRTVFAGGASHYGISNCELLAKDTHKFESRYLDALIGPYPAQRDVYIARSPFHHLDRLDRPVIFFQGLDDEVVPPNQAEMLFEALRCGGIPTAYVPFAGERHGFRKAENIRRALEAELYFFGRILGFTPADPIPPVPIENL